MVTHNELYLKPNIQYAIFVACNTVYTGVNGTCKMLHEIELFPISCSMLQAPLTPV